jgi:hypothetical protein
MLRLKLRNPLRDEPPFRGVLFGNGDKVSAPLNKLSFFTGKDSHINLLYVEIVDILKCRVSRTGGFASITTRTILKAAVLAGWIASLSNRVARLSDKIAPLSDRIARLSKRIADLA